MPPDFTFTPGPWTFRTILSGSFMISASIGSVAIVNNADNAEANAALIAESPTRDALLVEALALHAANTDPTPDWYRRAAASHARSRGEAP